jgi:hypothetical protein
MQNQFYISENEQMKCVLQKGKRNKNGQYAQKIGCENIENIQSDNQTVK